MEQRSDEWFEIRKGRFTGSEIFKIMTAPRSKADREDGKISATAETYILQNVAEMLSNSQAKRFQSDSMERGSEMEEEAILFYELSEGVKVQDVGFVTYGDSAGVSPDGLVDKDGGLELKCPDNNTIHLSYCRLKTHADLKKKRKDYYWQCIYGLLCTSREWWDFATYSDRYDGKLKMSKIRILKEDVEEDIKLLDSAIKKAIEERNKIIIELI